MHKALFYNVIKDNTIRCNLCPNYCEIEDGNYGRCRNRKNETGILLATNYGRTVAINLDPIEKKPLYHYYPGSQILSLGPNSCNLHCTFCQNYETSQRHYPTNFLSPEELLNLMQKKSLHQVAFTYTEPFTWYEYILDCGRILKSNDIRIVLVTNGYINQAPLNELLPFIDAMNIDLKSFNDEFYINICGGKLKPILETISTAYNYCHIELTNLLIPNLNDEDKEVRELVEFVNNISPDIPLHFSKYFPRWHEKQLTTSERLLMNTYEYASDILNFVYLGNLPNGNYSNTYCPSCKNTLIKRNEFSNIKNRIDGNACNNCGRIIYGRFK